jgi:NADPH:quinone reductase-like Zn-dependent oxidoreductase
MERTMRALLLPQKGTVEAMRLHDDVAVPTPGPGEVLIKVHAAALNPVDQWVPAPVSVTRFHAPCCPPTLRC